MKRLFLIRHAKSSWELLGQSDFDRPLNDRGLRDAPDMAMRLYRKGIELDALVSSPAARAFATAKFFAGQFNFKTKDISLKDQLYHAPAQTFYDVIQHDFKDAWNSVAIFSHNPGITYFVNSLGVATIDNMPTCAIFGVEANTKKWNGFFEAEKHFLLFDYPKNK
jgi:phosphohistidine phosphatase